MNLPANIDLERLQHAVTRAEIETLVVECAYLLDRGDFAPLVALFTEDCEFFTPKPPFFRPQWALIRGRSGLAQYYSSPPWSSPQRTMRHVITNLRLHAGSADRIPGTATLIGFRHEGTEMAAALPMMVGDYEDVYQRGADGRWRVARRKVVPAFLSQALLEERYPAAWGIGPVAERDA